MAERPAAVFPPADVLTIAYYGPRAHGAPVDLPSGARVLALRDQQVSEDRRSTKQLACRQGESSAFTFRGGRALEATATATVEQDACYGDKPGQQQLTAA